MAKFWEDDPLVSQGAGGGGKFWENDPITSIPEPTPRPEEVAPTNIFTGTGMPQLESAANKVLGVVDEYVPGFKALSEAEIPGALELKKQLQVQVAGQGFNTADQIDNIQNRINELQANNQDGSNNDKIEAYQRALIGYKVFKAPENLAPELAAIDKTKAEIAALPKSEFSKKYEKAVESGTLKDWTSETLAAIEDNPVGAAKSMTGMVVQSAPMIFSTVFGGPVGAGLFGATTTYHQSVFDEIEKRGGKLTDLDQFMKVYRANKDEILTAAKGKASVSGAFNAALGALPGPSNIKEGVAVAILGTGIMVGQGATQRYLDQIPVIDTNTGSPLTDASGKVVMQDAPPMTAAEWADLTAQSAAMGIPVALLAGMRSTPTPSGQASSGAGPAGTPLLTGPRPLLPGPGGPAAPVKPSASTSVKPKNLTQKELESKLEAEGYSPEQIINMSFDQIFGNAPKPAPAQPPSPAGVVEAQGPGKTPAPEAPVVNIPPEVQQAIDTLTTVNNAKKLLEDYQSSETAAGFSRNDLVAAENIVNSISPERIAELQNTVNSAIEQAMGPKPPVLASETQAPSAKAEQLVKEGASPLTAIKEAAASPIETPIIEAPAKLPIKPVEEAIAPLPQPEVAVAPETVIPFAGPPLNPNFLAPPPVSTRDDEAPSPDIPTISEEEHNRQNRDFADLIGAKPNYQSPFGNVDEAPLEEGNLTKPTSESPINTEEAITENVAPPLKEEDNIDKLSNAFEPVLGSDGFKNILQARKIAKETVGTEDDKLVEEAMELAIVKKARKIVDEGNSTVDTYDNLVNLYNKQPNLSTRTSTSILQQAYSTPVPLAYVASRLAGIDKGTTVLEPTAGNGALLIGADQNKSHANELNAVRRRNLEKQGFKATGHDAATIDQITPNKSANVIIANPPFGTVKDENGDNKVFNLDFAQQNYKTKEIDHAISLKALEEMDDDGRAVLIVGSVNPQDGNREDSYNGKSKREFFYTLYNKYKVTDHFTVDGKLYSKQGASWPVDVIVINGRGKTEGRSLPAVKAPEMITSWDQLKEKLANEHISNEKRPVRPPVETIQQPDSKGKSATTSGSGENDVGQRPAGGKSGVSTTGGISKQPSIEQPKLGSSVEPSEPKTGTERGNTKRLDQLAPDGKSGLNESLTNEETVTPPSQPEELPTKKLEPKQREQETAGQVSYEPKSTKTQGLGTLVPINMKTATQNALNKIETKHGSIDKFVAEKLGYKIDDLAKYFSAEQVDALGMAIDNFEKGAGFIIGDQTGIGKGRVNAGVIRYALKNKMIPIFTTEKPNLYGDMYRDMNDIGIQDILGGKNPRILMTNSNESVPLDEDGEVTLKTGAKHNDLLKQLATQGSIGDYNIVFTTYNQMQTVKGKQTERQTFLEAIASKSLLILDESHNAGGSANADNDEGMSRAQFVRNLVGEAKAVFYSSATYAKRPDVMDLYYKTDMSKAVSSPEALAEAIQNGGIPMQQVVASMLADAGQYIRRERSFAGVTYDAREVSVDLKTYDDFCDALSQIQRFSDYVANITSEISKDIKAEAKSISPDGSTGGAGAESTNFTALMHNIVSQMLLAMKVKPAVDLAIESLKNGKKPVLTVANTMGAFLKEIQEQGDANSTEFVRSSTGSIKIKPLENGGIIDMDFNDLLMRYLERNRYITIKRPFMFKGEKAEKVLLTNEQLGEGGVRMFHAIKDYISNLDLSKLPISPIDYMKNELQKKGYKVGEITGRGLTIDYSGKKPVLSSRPASELNVKGRRNTINAFNNLDMDVIVLNQAGATGLSIHASGKFKNQQKRQMILVQPEANIDTHMQMLGRVHRTGQVVLPEYIQMIANIPAEKRPAAVLSKKMASLAANTTGARKGALSAENAPDFMNEYGDQVAVAFMEDNPELQDRLNVEISVDRKDSKADNSDLMRKLTGRLVLLRLKEQEEIYVELEARYKDLMEQLEAQGVNTLEAKTLDLDAKLIEEKVAQAGEGDSPFTKPVVYGHYDVKRQGKPISMRDAIDKVVDANDIKEIPPDDIEALKYLRISKPLRDKSQNLYSEAVTDFKLYERAILDETESNKQTKESDRLWAIRSAFNVASDMLVPGRRVRVTGPNGETSVGLVVSVARGGKTKNPLALGDWRVTFALPSAQPMLTMPFSQLQIDGEYGQRTVISNPSWADEEKMTVKIFNDLAKSDIRDKRVIATGNILAGFDLINGKGTIINFTTDDGELKQGIMLPVGVKTLDQAFGSSKVVLKTGKEVKDHLLQEGKTPRTLVTPKQDVMINVNPWDNWVQIIVPRAKNQGGKYYLDKTLLGILGTDFTSSGRSAMKAEIRKNSEKFETVLGRLIELGARFEVEGNKPAAQYASMQQLEPKAKADAQPLYDELRGIVERLVGDKAGVEFMNTISMEDATAAERSGGVAKGNAAGAYDDVAGIIYLATDLESGASPGDAVYHEAWHVIDKFLTSDERSSLEKNRERNAVAVAKFYGVTPEKILSLPISEQDAYAMGMFGAMMDAGIKLPEGSLSRSTYETFHKGWLMWKRFRNAVKKFMGFRDASTVFTDFYFGSMSDRIEQTAEDMASRIGLPELKLSFMAMGRRRNAAPPSTNFEMPSSNFGKELLYGLVEKYNDLREVQKSIEDFRGSPLPESMDAYLALQLYNDRAINRQKVAWDSEVKPLLKALQENKIADTDFSEFLYARHAEERNAEMAKRDAIKFPVGGSGMKTDEADRILDEFRRNGTFDTMNRLANRFVYPMLKRDLRDRFNAGLLTSEQYDQYTKGYQYYVPLTGFAEDEAQPNSAPPQVGRGFSLRGKEYKSATGRKSRARNPLINAIQKRMDGIVRAEKAIVDKALYELVKNNPNKELATIMNPFNVPKRRILASDGTVVEVPDFGMLNLDVSLPVKIDGKQHYIVFNDDNPNMVRLVKSLKNMNENTTEVMKHIMTVGRFMSKINTTWVPDFFMVNFPRDIQDSMINMYGSKKGLNTEFVKEFASSAQTIFKVVTGKTLSRQEKSIYDEWILSGGKQDFGGFETFERAQEKINEAMREAFKVKDSNPEEMVRLLKKGGLTTLEAMEKVNQLFEDTIRFAVYRAARKNGYTTAKAAQLSRRATVDFRAKGAWMPWMNALKPFLSARIGGIRSMVRLYKGGKRGRQLLAALFALCLLNSLMAFFMSEDDENEPGKKKYFTQVKGYERLTHLILPFTNSEGNYYKIPYGFILNPIAVMADNLVAVSFGQIEPINAAVNMVTSWTDSFNPLGNGSMVHSILPFGFQQLVETSVNRDWKGQKIHPEVYPGQENFPAAQEAFPSTSDESKSIADWLSRATGGDAYNKGWMDIYPGTIDYWAQNLTQGIGAFVKGGYKALENTWEGIDTPYQKMPFFRRFLTNTDKISDNKYFETKSEVTAMERQMSNAYQNYVKNNKDAEAKETAFRLAEKLDVNLRGKEIQTQRGSVPGILKKSEKELDSLKNQIDDIKNNSKIPDDMKEDKIAPLTQKMIDKKMKTMRDINEKIKPPTESPLMLLFGQ
jgi:hypothetical protein